MQVKRGIIVLILAVVFCSCQLQADAQATQDIGWPRQVKKNGSVLVYYQPQVDEWKDYKQLTANMAFSLTPKNGRQVLGVASFSCGTLVDKDARNVYLRDIQIPDVRFPQLSADSAKLMGQLFKELVPTGGEPISLDRLTADISEHQRSLPKDMSKLPAGENFDDVKKMVPPPPPSGTVPQVFFSSKPAELILLRGAPIYSTIAGTHLLYVTNSDNDIFVDNTAKQFYILLSGRWFRSDALGGPWIYAGDNLPADFGKIPENSPKSGVLASVPGTVQASDAVILAQIPQTAIVNKAEAEAKVKVSYDGDPQFKSIENTSLQYATNTQYKVIQVGDLYYLCFQAVWFMSTSPKGPWKTADSVPKEIYTIPPSSPVYNVTYVTQTNPTPTTVESSSTEGYLGMFIIGMAVGACIVYGTGYYYPPYMYYGHGMLYPVYRPWPCTYGVGAVYHPATGGWAAGRAVYGPYGAARSSAWYNPATGRYGRSASVQGWYGGRTAASTYNPWTGGYGATRQGHNTYAQWGTSVAGRGDQWVQTGHVTTARGTTSAYRTSTGQSGVVTRGANGTTVRTGNNNVYAGHDGNVYKKEAGGSWSQYNNGSWQKPANASANTMHGLGSSDQARQRGQAQTQQFQRRSGGGRSGGFRRR